MKKFITAIILATLLFSVDSVAQSFSNTLVKVDTTIKPASAFRIGVNKLDNQPVIWDKVSWKSIATTLRDTVTLDFASADSITVSDLTKTIAGARLGDEVVIGVPNAAVTATGTYTAWVSAANTVKIRFSPKLTEDPASGVFHISVLKYYQWR